LTCQFWAGPTALARVAAAVEIVGSGMFGYEDKYGAQAGLRVLAALSDADRIALETAAVTMFDALSCSGIAQDGTWCYIVGVSVFPEITQRDLRMRSREIMDAVEHGQSFTVTRGGHRIGELVPLRRRRRFVSRQEFAAMSRNAPAVDLEAFRADQEAALDQEPGSRYER